MLNKMRERLVDEPSKELSELIFRPAIIRDFRLGFNYLIQINEAHVVMLADSGIISKKVASKLLTELGYLRERKLSEDDLDPNLEDLHFNVEKLLIQKTGSEIGGRMHTGRSRNDLHATLDRMILREMVIEILDLINQLRKQLLEFASNHVNTIMTGYTHMQPAQPITLGHYMCAIALTLERDSKRLEATYETINQCPLGACALAGTDFPIDRKKTAELLGFEDLLENSLDAVASRDWIPELLAALSIMMTNISRLSTDLYIWCTDEFSYIDIKDSIAAVSSIMPQKKNPIIFEHCKAKAAHVHGALISSLSCLKNTPFGHSRDIAGESIVPIWNGINETQTTLKLIQIALSSIVIRKENMADRVNINFSTATKLANTLVRDYNLPFRIAHSVIAILISKAIVNSVQADSITPEMLDDATQIVIGKKLDISASTLRSIFEPNSIVCDHTSLGGPSQKEVKRMVLNAEIRLKECCSRVSQKRDIINQALNQLLNQVKKIIKSI